MAITMMGDLTDSFTLLQRLAQSFLDASRGPLGQRQRRTVHRLAASLGATAVPLCGRELCSGCEARSEWAFSLLIALAEGGERERVVRAMREMAKGTAISDDGKLRALTILAELGESDGGAQLRDPDGARRESILKLAGSLETACDVAGAAAAMLEQLDPDELVSFLTAVRQISPRTATLLGRELLVRDDLEPEHLAGIEPLCEGDVAPLPPSRGRRHAVFARHPDGHSLVAAYTRRHRSQPVRYRSLTALIDPDGVLLEMSYGDESTRKEIENGLLRDFAEGGFELQAVDLQTAADRVCDALAAADEPAPAAFYLGRDLLGLSGDPRTRVAGHHARVGAELATGRGLEAYRAGELELAETLFRTALAERDVARARSGLGLCAMARGDLDEAMTQLELAARLEPEHAEHLWNLAACAHRRGCRGSCYIALAAFADKTEASDPRLAHAQAFTREFERQGALLYPDSSAMAVASADRDCRRAQEAIAAGRPGEAESLLERSTARVDTHFPSWTLLAELRTRGGRLHEARAAASRALHANPTYQPASQVLGFVTSALDGHLQ